MGIQFSALSSAFLTITALTWLPAVAAAQPARSPVQVMLQNEANVPSELVERARGEVTRLFALIDIEMSISRDVDAHSNAL